MDKNSDKMNLSHVKFFGRLSASVSHELNNAVGIINENAGLMEDLCLIAKKGKTKDFEKLIEICGKINDQVKRAAKITGDLNLFSHSADKESIEMDPLRYVNLVKDLLGRFLSEKESSVEVINLSMPDKIKMNPFIFSRLVGEILLSIVENSTNNKQISIETAFDGKNLRFFFRFSNPECENFSLDENILKSCNCEVSETEDGLILNIIPEE